MKSETISALHGFALDSRALLQNEMEEQLEGTYGWLPSGKFQPSDKYPSLSQLPEASITRAALEQFLEDEKAAGVVDARNSRLKVVKEASFTWLNRLVAFKIMEIRGLIKGTVSRVTDSNAFKLWVVDDGNEGEYEKYELGDLPQNLLGEGPRQEAYRHFLLWQCGKLAEEIRVLFEPHSLASRLFPRPPVLVALIESMNDSKLEEAWAPGNEETIGWIYQGFNSLELEEAFRATRLSGKKFAAEDIPTVSQLFTPRWIVRYLVENTLGRLWMEMHPDSRLADDFKYLVPLKTSRTEHLRLAREITLLDPACGTMHFGLVAFDIFARIYNEEIERAGNPGWPESASVKDKADIPAAVISENIHGIDIDLRAVQLSALALYIKAKSLNPKAKIVESKLACANVSVLDGRQFQEFVEETGLRYPIYSRLLQSLCERLKNSRQLGSLLKLEELIPLLVEKERESYEREGRQPDLFGCSDELFETEEGRRGFWEILEKQIEQALNEFARTPGRIGNHHSLFVAETVKGLRLLEILANNYDVVVTNPPYISTRKMNSKLKGLVGHDYPECKMDLYAAFIKRCLLLARERGGRVGMLTMQSFMFISSYERLRIWLRQKAVTESLVHCGPALFDVGNPATLQTSAYILRSETNSKVRDNSVGSYFRLVKEPDGESKQNRFELALMNLREGAADPVVFRYRQGDFDAIPGIPWVYWILHSIKLLFENCDRLGKIAPGIHGTATYDNFRFLRFWWEIGIDRIGFNNTSWEEFELSEETYVPYMKGGPLKRWYGNQEYVLQLLEKGTCLKSFLEEKRDSIRGQEYIFRQGVTWSDITSGSFGARLSPGGFIFDVKGSSAFPNDIPLVLGFLNSSFANYILNLINPTVSYQVGDISRLPIPSKKSGTVKNLVKAAVSIARCWSEEDETTFEFVMPPPWPDGIDQIKSRATKLHEIESKIDVETYRLYGITNNDRKSIEAELNGGLVLGVSEEEPETVAEQDANESAPAVTQEALAVRWISYAIGVALGRFNPGVPDSLGRGRFVDSVNHKLHRLSGNDGILVMDNGHPADLSKLTLEVLSTILGETGVQEVVRAAQSNEGDTIELLRHYVAKDFFKLHIKQYRKRPVYWLLQSPKKKYGVWIFHERLTKDSIFRIRSEYVQFKIKLLDAQIADVQNKVNVAEGREKRGLEKKMVSLHDTLDDVREFERHLKYISESRGYIPHIDDGVLLNIAPLWELIPSWQAEPKKAWEALETGKYDWSYQAMDHWPERVRDNCKTNKSFAIAHGVLNLYEKHGKGDKK